MRLSDVRRALGIVALIAMPAALFAAGTKDKSPAPAGSAEVSGTAKYVFMFIGDGMGIPQISSAEIYANAIAAKDIKVKKLRFSQFPAQGLTTTYDAGTFITDSASAATALATGNKTLSGVVNMDPGKKVKYKTIAEYAKEKGMKVGIITSVSLDHATPACYYAKVPSRGDYYDIAAQFPESGFDFFGGGGFLQPTGKNKDKTSILELAKAKGYTYVNSKDAFVALKPGSGKVLAVNAKLQDSSAMPYSIDREAADLSLADYTRKAIELLTNDKGFFIMVEGGKIDWACHANDAASSIGDTFAFDEAVGEAVRFCEQHPADTLIVVTGDHETGGMTIGFAGTKYNAFFDKIAPQKGSYVRFDSEVLKPLKEKAKASKGSVTVADLIPAVESYFGLKLADLSDPEKELLERAFKRSLGGEIERAAQEDVYLLYGGYEPFTVAITHVVNQKAGIGWTTYSHTGSPVMTFAMGVGQSLFDGYYDNTDIFTKLAKIMAVQVAVAAR